MSETKDDRNAPMTHSEWIKTLTPGTVVNCYYNGRRKTTFRAWMQSANSRFGYRVKLSHHRIFIDSCYIGPCEKELPIAQ
jgi:hypothetical protein